MILAACTTTDKREEVASRPDSIEFPPDSVYDIAKARTDSILDRRVIKDSMLPLISSERLPRVNVSRASVNTSRAGNYSADSSLYWIRYVLNKPLRSGDTVRIRLTRDSIGGLGLPTLSTVRYRFAQRDSAGIVVDKVFGRVAKYTGCVRVQKGAYTGQSVCPTWTTNFAAKPDTTPPVVDTVKVDSSLAIKRLNVKPDTVTLAIGKSQQFCPFIVFQDGKVALRSQDSALADCRNEYLKFPLAVRNVTVAQQQVADKMCVAWQATGGTITAEPCGSPS